MSVVCSLVVVFNVSFFLYRRRRAPELSSGDPVLDGLVRTYVSAQFYTALYVMLAIVLLALVVWVLIASL
jgi:hypothetical protein